LSNATSVKEAFIPPQRRSKAPVYISGIVAILSVLTALITTTKGVYDPLKFSVEGPSVHDYENIGESSGPTVFSWSDQSIENWTLEQYNLKTADLDWLARGFKASPIPDVPGDVFAFEKVHIELRNPNSKKKERPVFTLKSEVGRARFRAKKSVDIHLGNEKNPVTMKGQGLDLKIPSAHVHLPILKPKNPGGKKDLAQSAQNSTFSMDEVTLTAPGPAFIKIQPGLLQESKSRENLHKDALMSIRSDGGLALDGMKQLILKGPVRMTAPAELLQRNKKQKPSQKKSAKKNSLFSAQLVQTWFPKGAVIRSGLVTVNFLHAEGKGKTILGYHMICENGVRIQSAGDVQDRVRCERLELLLLANHVTEHVGRGIGGPGGCSLLALESMQQVTLIALKAQGKVWIDGEIQQDPKLNPTKVKLVGELIEWQRDEGLLNVRGTPARLIERELKGDLKRQIEAEYLQMNEDGNDRRIHAKGQVYTYFKQPDGQELTLKGEDAKIFLNQSLAIDLNGQKRVKQSVRAFQLAGKPAFVEEKQKRRRRTMRAETIKFSDSDLSLIARGQIDGDFLRLGKIPVNNNIRGDALRVVFESNPFKGLELKTTNDENTPKDKKPKKAKKQKMDIGGQIKTLHLEGLEGRQARIIQSQGDERRQLQSRTLSFRAEGNVIELEDGIVGEWSNPKDKTTGSLRGDRASLFFSENPFKAKTKRRRDKKTGQMKDKKKDQRLLKSLIRIQIQGQPGQLALNRETQSQSFQAEQIEFDKVQRLLVLTNKVVGRLVKGLATKQSVASLRGDEARLRFLSDPMDLIGDLKTKQDTNKKGKKLERKRDKKAPKIDLENFESIELSGTHTQIQIQQSPKEPKVSLKAQSFTWRAADKTLEARPGRGQRVLFERSDGVSAVADQVHWLNDERILILRSDDPEKPVLLKDKDGSKAQADLLVLHWPQVPVFKELEIGRGPEIIIDLAGRVSLELKSDAKFLSSFRKSKKDKKADQPGEKPLKDSKKKSKAGRSIPLFLKCDHARIFLIEKSEPGLTSFALSSMVLQGQNERNVTLKGMGKKARDQFTVQAPAIRITGDETIRHIVCATRPRQRPQITTVAGDRLAGDELEIDLIKTASPLSKGKDQWQAHLRLSGGVRGRFTSITRPKDKKTKKRKVVVQRNDINAEKLEAALNLDELGGAKKDQSLKALHMLKAQTNVVVNNSTVQALGDSLEYNAEKQEMILTGKPVHLFFKKSKNRIELPKYVFHTEDLRLPVKKKEPDLEAKRRQ
jgi:lipopolysaccharide export system protein LptA